MSRFKTYNIEKAQNKMSSIVVGTDFSNGSYMALELAIDIANKMKTDVKLIWVKREKKLFTDEQLDSAIHLATDKLADLQEKYSRRLTGGKFTAEVRSGKVAQVLGAAAKEEKAPMIVCGTNGASGFERYFMGSTAVRIVQDSPCPVLTIREGFNFHKDLENIVMPIRVNETSRQKVPFTTEMARIFGSRVHILGLIDSPVYASDLRTYIFQIEEYMKQEGVKYSSVVKRYSNYCDTVMKYAEDIDADLVAINTEQNIPLNVARIFLGTNAQQIVHHSQIPVLCIHPHDIGWLSK